MKDLQNKRRKVRILLPYRLMQIHLKEIWIWRRYFQITIEVEHVWMMNMTKDPFVSITILRFQCVDYMT